MATITRVRTVFTGVAGTPWYSNQHFAGTSDSQDYTELIGDFWDQVGGSMYAAVSWSTDAFVTFIDTETGQPTGTEGVAARSGQCSGAGAPLPFANQMLINLRTGIYRGGREVRGKLFVPGLVEGSVAGGSFSGGFANAVTAAADEIRQAPVIADDFWLVYSPKNKAAYPVTSNAASTKPAVLRSRRD